MATTQQSLQMLVLAVLCLAAEAQNRGSSAQNHQGEGVHASVGAFFFVYCAFCMCIVWHLMHVGFASGLFSMLVAVLGVEEALEYMKRLGGGQPRFIKVDLLDLGRTGMSDPRNGYYEQGEKKGSVYPAPWHKIYDFNGQAETSWNPKTLESFNFQSCSIEIVAAPDFSEIVGAHHAGVWNIRYHDETNKGENIVNSTNQRSRRSREDITTGDLSQLEEITKWTPVRKAPTIPPDTRSWFKKWRGTEGEFRNPADLQNWVSYVPDSVKDRKQLLAYIEGNK